MFDGLYQDETDTALALEAETPRVDPKKPVGFFSGMGTALIEGPTQGALTTLRAGRALLDEYGKAAAFREGAPKAESIDKMFTEQSPAVKALGLKAQQFDPNPETSSTAAQVVHGFTKFATEMVVGSVVGGPAAPLLVGGIEGIGEGLKLSDKGVDPGTAAKAGLVHGLSMAAAVALPVAGPTLKATAGIAAVSGPGLFMGEQAAIRGILEAADYGVLAAEYDPFDTTGLVVNTLAPFAFGAAAHGLRAKVKVDALGAPKLPAPPDVVVDAARVELLNQHDLALVQGKGPEAVLEHTEGRKQAADRIQEGEPTVGIERGTEGVTGPAAVAETLSSPRVVEVSTDAPSVEPAPAAVAPVLQNRDRATPASIVQMQSIAGAPDYLRVSPGRSLAEGAPVVIAEADLPATQIGRTDVAIDAQGGRVDVRYAVIEADQLLPSHTASGIPNADYDVGVPGRARAVAGNARVAGLQRGYETGTTAAYREALAGDASHGVPADVIQGMRQPVLVRLMESSAVTRDIGDRTNVTGVSALSTVEAAANDAKRVKLESLEFAEDGSPTPEAVRRFVQGMPASEQAALIDSTGAPTRQAEDRLMAATFKKAYGDDDLVRLYASATDPEARNVISGMGQAASEMARLEGAGELDIRAAVVAAAKSAINAKRSGVKLADFARQGDFNADPLSSAVVGIFARNARSAKKIGQEMQDLAGFIARQADAPAEDMFGPVPKLTREAILARLEGTEAPKAAEAGQVHPDVARAEAAIAARGDFEIELEDGRRVSAKQALAEADQVIAEAKKEGSAIAAAAECFLEGAL